MNAMMALTLIDENQNSNSPNERADVRFTSVMATISTQPLCQAGIVRPSSARMFTAAITSMGITTTQKNQYNQPTENPAQLPSPSRANSVKERASGFATAISPSIRMTISTSSPVNR